MAKAFVPRVFEKAGNKISLFSNIVLPPQSEEEGVALACLPAGERERRQEKGLRKAPFSLVRNCVSVSSSSPEKVRSEKKGSVAFSSTGAVFPLSSTRRVTVTLPSIVAVWGRARTQEKSAEKGL